MGLSVLVDCLLQISIISSLSPHYLCTEIDVCVTFATQQPASRGNLAIHCGGPGGLTLCNYAIWLELDEEARCKHTLSLTVVATTLFMNVSSLNNVLHIHLATYNLIGFDQVNEKDV